jgi:hypothetical protein
MVVDPNVTFTNSGSNTPSSVVSNDRQKKIPSEEEMEEGREKSPSKMTQPVGLTLELLPTK